MRDEDVVAPIAGAAAEIDRRFLCHNLCQVCGSMIRIGKIEPPLDPRIDTHSDR